MLKKSPKVLKQGRCEETNAKGRRKDYKEVNNTIEDIFSSLPKKTSTKSETGEQKLNKQNQKRSKKRKQPNEATNEKRVQRCNKDGPHKDGNSLKEGNCYVQGRDDAKPVRYDDDGLPIYTAESLKIGKGGGTSLCPFDCNCCF
mmetsp:Transcript_2032/g.2732  ORF Transcript_2032/g.2732 Transcript_2032/m.2732 type:complete len:144 (+) Transcript_2032:99-530(+)